MVQWLFFILEFILILDNIESKLWSTFDFFSGIFRIRDYLIDRETKRSIRVYLVLRFWCFKNFQMPPPKKYDNKILHVGPVEVFWHFRQNLPNFTRFFPQILGKKMSLSDVIKISYVVSTCRTWWSFLTLSAKFPQFWGKKCP